MLHNEFNLQFLEMIRNKSDIRSIRKLIADSSFSDYTELFRLLYDEVETITGDKIPEVIADIASGAYQDVLVVDKEINFIATVSKILGRL